MTTILGEHISVIRPSLIKRPAKTKCKPRAKCRSGKVRHIEPQLYYSTKVQDASESHEERQSTKGVTNG